MREQSYKILNNSQSKDIRGGETKVMKKLLSSLLVLALLFTMAVPAFAATPSDVKGTDSEEAVAKLAALGVLSGYPDGTFRPDNDITRAEFAKIVAYAAGFASAAEYLGSVDTSFSDVKADNGYGWASGYIAVAANKGYLKGYPDGTFKPANKVTYAEVATVLLRVLGYNDTLVGTWPSNYIIQADDLGLLDGVGFVANKAATRGDVAILTSGTLEQNLVAYDKDLDLFLKYDITLISKAFENSFKKAVVAEPNFVGDDEDQVALYVWNATTKTYSAVANYDAADLYIIGANSVADVWGHEVEVLLDGSDVKVINNIQDVDNIVEGTVEAVAADVYTLTIDDEDYDFAANSVVFVNDVEEDASVVTADAEAKLFLNADGDVRFAVVSQYDANKVNLQISDLSKVATTGTAYITFTNAVRAKVDVDTTKFTVNGKEVAYADLAEDMIVNYVVSGTTATIVNATENAVTGEVESASSKGTVTIGGKAYSLDGVVHTAFTVGEEFTLFLNAAGKVVAFEQVTGTNEDGFAGFAVESDEYQASNKVGDTYEETTFVAANGNVVTYKSEAVNVVGSTYNGQFVDVDLVDGEVVAVNTLIDVQNDTAVAVGDITSSVSRIDLGGDVYRYDASTVVFDVTDYDVTAPSADDVKVMKVSDLEEGMEVLFSLDGTTLDYIVVTNNQVDSATQLEPTAGIFVEEYSVLVKDDTEYYAVLNVEGEEVTVQLDGALSATEGDLVALVDVDETGLYDVPAQDVEVGTYAADTETFDVTGTTYFVTDLTTIYVLSEDTNGDLVVELGTTFDIEENTGAASFTTLVEKDGTLVDLAGGYEVNVVVVDLR